MKTLVSVIVGRTVVGGFSTTRCKAFRNCVALISPRVKIRVLRSKVKNQHPRMRMPIQPATPKPRNIAGQQKAFRFRVPIITLLKPGEFRL